MVSKGHFRNSPSRPGCEMLRIPQCPDSRLTDGGKVVSSTYRGALYSPETFFLLLVLISVRGLVNHRA
jgi:hypothetical protein